MRIYVASYGGCGSWLLVNYLRNRGVDCYHTHNIKPPTKICNIKYKTEKYNIEFKKLWYPPTEKEVFNYNELIPSGKIIFIYRKPIYTLLSKKSGNLYHFENLEVDYLVHRKLMKLGFNYDDTKLHIESLKRYFQLDKDIINYENIFDNYHNCTWNENYNILSINFDCMWNNMEEICKFIGKEYDGKFPIKQHRKYDENIIKESERIFNKINQKIDNSLKIKIS